MASLSEMGINVIENEEQDEVATGEAERGEPETRTAATSTTTTLAGPTTQCACICAKWGRGAAVARRRDRDRQADRGRPGDDDRRICESPLTIRAIIQWHNALKEGKMLLRDIIDLDATYGAGPFGADGKDEADDPDADDRPTAGYGGAGASVGGNGHDQGDDALVSADRSAAPGPHASGNGVAGNGASAPAARPDGGDATVASERDEAAKPPAERLPRRKPARARPARATARMSTATKDEAGPSLSAMEEALKPQVLETFDRIEETYAKLHKLQDQRSRRCSAARTRRSNPTGSTIS